MFVRWLASGPLAKLCLSLILVDPHLTAEHGAATSRKEPTDVDVGEVDHWRRVEQPDDLGSDLVCHSEPSGEVLQPLPSLDLSPEKRGARAPSSSC
jgi:hypothetical protein